MIRTVFAALLLTLAARPAAAFEYLEHSFFTDRACREAQRILSGELTRRTAPAYLALALACPERWDRPYCAGGYKQLEGNLNDLARPPAQSHDQSITLGDLSALPDHLSEFGAIRNVRRLDDPGLTSEVLGWLVPGTGDPGGVIADVAEDACETGGRVDWDEVMREVALALAPDARLSAPAPWLRAPRAPVIQGPTDPAGPYSFDNPHYLDLVLMNEHHFGAQAHGSWLGFHAAAVAVSERPCVEVIALRPAELRHLAEGLPGFEEIRWRALDDETRRRRGCELIAERLHGRLLRWAGRADPELVAPARPWIDQLRADPGLADAVVTAFIGLVLEGAGLHFLQDGLAAGHLRVDRSAYGLGVARFLHDEENRHGVAAAVGTRTAAHRFVSFGDGFLLGRSTAPEARCRTQATGSAAETTACLLRLQRGLLVRSTTASLLDYALRGPTYEAAPNEDCPPSGARGHLCAHLPTRPTAAWAGSDETGSPRLGYGSVPQPPPSFSYQSLSMAFAVDGTGEAVQTGARLVFLSALGRRADWMTSWHFGLLATHRPSSPEILGEVSYMFHWRWAARWLINAGPYLFGGLRGFGDAGPAGFSGLGASVGTSLLPEGWIKLPLEISLTYRVPVTLLDGREGLLGDAVRLEAHWFEISLGLAFL